MKKILIVMLLLLFTFTGCDNMQNANNNTNLPPNNDLDVTNYKVVTSRMLFATQYAITEEGCYETLECSNGTGNVLYTDFASRTKQFLSANISSRFNDDSDTSWLSSIHGGTSTFIAGEKLYILKRGKNKIDDGTDKYRTYFEQMNFNGSEHKKLYIPAKMVIDEGSVIVFDGEKLYFIAVEYDDSQDKVIATRNLFSLETTNGEIKTALRLPQDSYNILIGAYDDSFILQRMIKDEDSQLPVVQIIEISVKNKENMVYQKENPQESVIFFEHEMFAFNPSNQKLISKNLRTDKTEITQINFASEKEVQSIAMVGDFYDRHLFFNIEDAKEQKSKKYAVQVDTKEIKKLNLYNNEMFVGIYAETNDKFLVITGEKVVTYPALSPDQISYFNENRYVYQLALIDKNDYWSNMPNFELIKDEVEYR